MQLIHTLFIATLAGLSVAPFFRVPMTTGMVAAVLLACALLLSWRKVGARHFLLALCCFLFANLNYSWCLIPSPDVRTIKPLTAKVVVEGTVAISRTLDERRTQVDLHVSRIRDKTRSYPLEQPLSLRLYIQENAPSLLPGDQIHFKSRLRVPRNFGSPGEFNWSRYLAGEGIDATGWIKSGEKITHIGVRSMSPWREIAELRDRLSELLESRLPAESVQLTRALLLGEKKVLDKEIRTVLSRAGVSHLFAISGLHLGLIALFSYRFFLFFYKKSSVLLEWQPPQRLLPFVLLPLLFLYLILTGDAVSTRRAFALALCGAFFLLRRVTINPLTLLVSLACLSLWVNPFLLWQAGWQLSFSGAAAILVWQPLWNHEKVVSLRLVYRYLVQMLIVTVAATLATAPLVLMNFHLLSPAGIVANLLCVPVVTLIALPLGLAGLLVSFLSPEMAIHLLMGCGFLLESLVDFCRHLTQLPGLEGWRLFLSRGQSLAAGLLFLFVLCLPILKSSFPRFRAMVVAFLLIGLLWSFPYGFDRSVSLTMFSVGQGESLLLQNNAGQAVLVDGGGLYSHRFDVGERLLAPALGELQVDALDAIVLTHDHPDHRKGLLFVLRHFQVDRFYSGHSLDDLHPDLVTVLKSKHVPVLPVPPGWSELPFWRGGVLRAFNAGRTDFSENDSSVALHLSVGEGDGLLLTGDLERDGVRALLHSGLPGPVSLLKLPHHGSRYSLTDELVAVLKPRLALASVGFRNRYRLPADDVVKMLNRNRVPLFRTDLDGTIRAEFRQNHWHVSRWEDGLFR